MGMAVHGDRLALATRHALTVFANAPELAPEYKQGGNYDALFLPRLSFHTTDLNVHDLGFASNGELWFANTRFSCLASPSPSHSFVPRWKPDFISALLPEDRCHLNGIAMDNGHPRTVSVLGCTDEPGGWRRNKATGGALLDTESQQVVVSGLAMPHSPRWYADRLWVLNSGAGELCTVDNATGQYDVVSALPGYLRGLAFFGKFAIIGLSKIREKHIFGGLPVHKNFSNLLCGVAVVDIENGESVGLLNFTAGCEEVYDVAFLAGIRVANILNTERPESHQATTTPEASWWMRPENFSPVDE
jgi:uncharacterized protein (TIGR03032 family)